MTQETAVLSYLSRGHALTPRVALSRFGIFRLAARIHRLRIQGHAIQSETVRRGNSRFARYWIAR